MAFDCKAYLAIEQNLFFFSLFFQLLSQIAIFVGDKVYFHRLVLSTIMTFISYYNKLNICHRLPHSFIWGLWISQKQVSKFFKQGRNLQENSCKRWLTCIRNKWNDLTLLTNWFSQNVITFKGGHICTVSCFWQGCSYTKSNKS